MNANSSSPQPLTPGHVHVIDSERTVSALALAPYRLNWVLPAVPENGLLAETLIEKVPATGTPPDQTLPTLSHLYALGEGVKIFADGINVVGSVSALMGAVHLQHSSGMLLARDVVEITLDAPIIDPKQAEEMRGRLVTKVDRDKPTDIFEAVGILLSVKNKKAIFIPLHGYIEKHRLKVLRPTNLTEDTASEKVVDFILQFARNEPTADDEARHKLRNIVGLPPEKEPVNPHD